jgi:O-antigen ligase
MAHVWTLWSSPRAARASRALFLVSAATLFLQSAATVDVAFTIRISYVVGLLALMVGLPFALRGWLELPAWLGVLAAGLLVSYLIPTLLSDQLTLAASTRSGELRSIVYLADIVFGLGLIGLVRGLWSEGGDLRDVVLVLVLSGALAAAYALYQWPAQHFGWPLSEVLTTRDSTGTTTAGNQGNGILGWERVRGTFLEPHFLGAFLSGTLPLLAALLPGAGRRSRPALGVVALALLAALALTSSVPSWAVLGGGMLFATILAAITFGRPLLAGFATAFAVLALLQSPILIASPDALAKLTGRDAGEIVHTTDFRTTTWERMLDIWSVKPVEGYGAGQSAVRLTLNVEGADAPALSSAQSVWAATLVDAGVVGLGMLIGLLGGIIILGVRAVLRRRSWELLWLTCGVMTALLSAAIAMDRLDQRVWIALGVLAAAAFPSARTSRSSPHSTVMSPEP